MKKLIVLIAVLIGCSAFAQDPYFQKDNKNYEIRAEALTETYNAELSMTAKQASLFEKKIEEFLPRYDELRKIYKGKEQLDRLVGLGGEEKAEMRNILTEPQYNLYIKLRKNIQPVGRVNE